MFGKGLERNPPIPINPAHTTPFSQNVHLTCFIGNSCWGHSLAKHILVCFLILFAVHCDLLFVPLVLFRHVSTLSSFTSFGNDQLSGKQTGVTRDERVTVCRAHTYFQGSYSLLPHTLSSETNPV